MKFNLLVLLLCLFSVASELFADSGEEDPLANNRTIDGSLDYLPVYKDGTDWQKLTAFKNKPFEIFNNIKLSGAPAFLIYRDKIIDLRNNEKKEFIFKNYFKPIPSTHSILVKDLPMSFIAASYNGFYLGISEYKSGIAMTKDNGKEYFFELNENHEFKWRFDSDPKSVLNYLQKLELEDKNFLAMITSIRKCIKEKKVGCLEILPTDRPILEWSISNDPELCKIFKEDSQKINELIPKLKSTIIPWDFYERVFIFKDPEISFLRKIENFSKNETINIKLEGKWACKANEYLDIDFKHDIVNKKWRFVINQMFQGM